MPQTSGRVVSRLGDLWQLGPNRIACGDCMQPDVVQRLLDGREPQLMTTDQPYGGKLNLAWRNRAGISSGDRGSAGHSLHYRW